MIAGEVDNSSERLEWQMVHEMVSSRVGCLEVE